MAEQYRATHNQWETIEEFAEDLNSGPACLLELRDRILCQEACIKDLYKKLDGVIQRLDGHFIRIKELEGNPITKQTPNDLQVGSSLVDRVAYAITGDGDGPINWKLEARAAIREVAVWLSEHAGGTRAAWLLEREAER